MKLLVFEDEAALAAGAAAHVAGLAAARLAAVRRGGRFRVALSGGGTPRALYRLFTHSPHRETMPWPRIDLFQGDERAVPPDHADSNARMVREALIDPLAPLDRHGSVVPIAPTGVLVPTGSVDPPAPRWFPVPAGLAMPAAVAGAYRETMRRTFAETLDLEDGFPIFDLVLLGLGADGHTASLFPGTRALDEHGLSFVGNEIRSLGAYRYTLTRPVFARARAIVFLVAGQEKREMCARLVAQDPSIPAGVVADEARDVVVLADRGAAG